MLTYGSQSIEVMMKASQVIQNLGERFLNPISLSSTSTQGEPIIFANQQFQDLTLYPQDKIIGHNCRFLQGPKTDKEAVLRIRHAIASKRAICQDLLNYKFNGEIFYNRLLLIPFKESEDEFFVGLQHEIDLSIFKPVHEIDELVLLDRTLNPIAILVSLLKDSDPDFEKNLLVTMKRIKNYILGL